GEPALPPPLRVGGLLGRQEPQQLDLPHLPQRQSAPALGARPEHRWQRERRRLWLQRFRPHVCARAFLSLLRPDAVNDAIEKFGLSTAQVQSAGAQWTAREIAQQPGLWPQIAREVGADGGLRAHLAPLLGNAALRIVLTGAGTSAYIGKCLAPALARGGRQTEAIPTTDIVASPQSTLGSKAPTLMVHFARSGSSPESVAALELAEKHIEDCHHLIVPCNAEGELTRCARGLRHAYATVLPEACNDQSSAMTSSSTGVMLAASLAVGAVAADPGRIDALAALGTEILTAHMPLAAGLVR